ncbi:MAG: hypothetical protein MHMPM18_001336 [Marteilia pararefringens]
MTELVELDEEIGRETARLVESTKLKNRLKKNCIELQLKLADLDCEIFDLLSAQKLQEREESTAECAPLDDRCSTPIFKGNSCFQNSLQVHHLKNIAEDMRRKYAEFFETNSQFSAESIAEKQRRAEILRDELETLELDAKFMAIMTSSDYDAQDEGQQSKCAKPDQGSSTEEQTKSARKMRAERKKNEFMRSRRRDSERL